MVPKQRQMETCTPSTMSSRIQVEKSCLLSIVGFVEFVCVCVPSVSVSVCRPINSRHSVSLLAHSSYDIIFVLDFLCVLFASTFVYLRVVYAILLDRLNDELAAMGPIVAKIEHPTLCEICILWWHPSTRYKYQCALSRSIPACTKPSLYRCATIISEPHTHTSHLAWCMARRARTHTHTSERIHEFCSDTRSVI